MKNPLAMHNIALKGPDFWDVAPCIFLYDTFVFTQYIYTFNTEEKLMYPIQLFIFFGLRKT
jgi:hypothetical protein